MYIFTEIANIFTSELGLPGYDIHRFDRNSHINFISESDGGVLRNTLILKPIILHYTKTELLFVIRLPQYSHSKFSLYSYSI